MLKGFFTKNEPAAAPQVIPRHVAIIMDGNGRWAKQRGLPRVEGHRIGVKRVRAVVEEARRLGVRYLTLFCFSTENWQRPDGEVSALMGLFKQYLASELDTMTRNGVRLRALGNIERLPTPVLEALQHAEKSSAHQEGLDLILAISYGGRWEIVEAARKILLEVQQGKRSLEDTLAQLDESFFARYLGLPDVPDPDLLIRTSDESRISNYLLWQLAYSEIIVTPVLWPDFDKTEFLRCLSELAGRQRRFGLTDEQIEAQRAQSAGGT